jgi:DNA-binding transcriptional regulator YhcF (GntR family)
MILEVDAASPLPPYEQIRMQIRALIDADVLRAGDRLPPIRQLAGDLGLATNTVQRAYRELETDGSVVARGRHGTVVAPRTPATTPVVADAVLDGATVLARRARHAGLSLDDLLHTVRVAFARLADGDAAPRHEEGIG